MKAKSRFLLVFLTSVAAGGAVAGDIVVAEFQADGETLLDSPSATAYPDYELNRPGDLYADEVGGSQERSWSIGEYRFSGVMDWGHRANYWAGERYSDEQFVAFGSKLHVGDSSETYVYHGYGRDRLSYSSDMFGGFGDAKTTRTGLSQSLYFADQQARVGVGYEYATGDRDRLYQDLEGHEVNLTGEVDIGWGFNAHLEAGYGLYSYSEFDGVQGSLSSARTNMRAGISKAFNPSLSWGLHYSYIDEEFEFSSLSESRQSWGLNLEYRY